MKTSASRLRRRALWFVSIAGVLIVATIVLWRGGGQTADQPEASGAARSEPATPVAINPTPRPAEAAMAAGVPLLRSAETEIVPEGAPVPPSRRVRVATIDADWLDRKHSPLFDASAAGTVVALPLWPDVDLMIQLQGTEVLGQDRHLVRGEIVGVPGSRFLLTVTADAVSFSVYLDAAGRHGAVPLGDGRVAIYELDPHAMPGCGRALPALPDSNALAEAAARPFAMRTGAALTGSAGKSGEPPVAAAVPATIAQVDVLMLYTPEVLAANQPDAALRNRVDLAIAEANDEFARSETRVRLREVGLRQVVYAESGNNSENLSRLRITNDTHMDEVHALRDELGADLVCLLVQRTDPTSIGIAYVLNSTADPQRGFNDLFGFSVVQNSVVAGTSTFAHEIGHNIGCAHDRENSSSAGAYPFSYGHRFVGSNNFTYRTIMAYQPGAAVPYFSNPRLTHPTAQQPLGVSIGLPAEADNATSINQASYSVASYRSNRQDPPARGRLVNVSTRAWVGTGDNVLIGGFYIGAPESKQVLLRVRGPTLAQFGVSDTLSDPQLELISQTSGQTILVNNDWGAAPDPGAIAASGLAPADSREPAILIALEPGGYTAIARGENNETGVALIEVFEFDAGSTPRLVNLSTRGFVGTGDRVMIGGIIVNGVAGETKRLILRALGPSLTDFGVANALFDPALRLYNEAGDELLDNDDWDMLSDTLQAQVRALDLNPTVRRESVLLVDLPPGQYTLIVRPFENDTGAEPGVGLVEAYEIVMP